MSEASIARFILAHPRFELEHSIVRSVRESQRLVFTGKQMAGQPSPFTAKQITEMAKVLKALNLSNPDILLQPYRHALANAASPADAWIAMAKQLLRQHVETIGEPEADKLFSHIEPGINTLGDTLNDLAGWNPNPSLQFRILKGSVIHQDQLFSVQSVCPFAKISLDALKIGLRLMGRKTHIPQLKFVLLDPRLFLRPSFIESLRRYD